MSIRCSILIEIPNDLIGQTVKYKKQDNESNWNINVDKTEPVKITKKYLGIYCHYDGHLDGVGLELIKKYNDFDSALNLILGGDCSSIIDNLVRYATRESEEWRYIHPRALDTIKKVSNDSEYLYVYSLEFNQWCIQICDILIPLHKDVESLKDYINGYLDCKKDKESFN